MINVLKNSSAFAYADDTAIIVAHKKIDEATRIMQNELNIITKWSHDNGLVINASKTKLMHIKPPHLPNHEINLIFHNNQCLHNTNLSAIDTCNVVIEKVRTYKYLGIYVDENFKWLTHIQNLRKKLRKASYNLFHLANCTPFNVLKQAYFSLAESYIRHGITAWGNSTYCSSLQQTQNQILKILLKNQQHNKQQIQYDMIYNNVRANNTILNFNTNVNNQPVNNTQTHSHININTNTYVNTTYLNNQLINNTHANNNTLLNINNNTPINNTFENNNLVNNNIPQNTYNNPQLFNTHVNDTTVNNNNLSLNYSLVNNSTLVNTNNYPQSNTNTIPTNIIVNNSLPINNYNISQINNINIFVNTNNNSQLHNVHANNNTQANNIQENNNTFINTNNTQLNYTLVNQTSSNRRNNLASNLELLNIKSIYNITLVNEFYNDTRFLKPIDHMYNTRSRAEGRFKVDRHRNNYGKNCLSVVLPNIFNKLPTNLINLTNFYKRKKLLKLHFMNSQ